MIAKIVLKVSNFAKVVLGRARHLVLAQLGLRGGEAGDRHAVRRARDVIEARLAAEADRGRVAAMLAANSELQFGPGLPAALDGDLDQLADTFRVDRHERVLLENP